MQAKVGDHIIIRGRRVGHVERDGEILAVEGPDGGPPYRVRWSDSDRVVLFFPGSGAQIQHRSPFALHLPHPRPAVQGR